MQSIVETIWQLVKGSGIPLTAVAVLLMSCFSVLPASPAECRKLPEACDWNGVRVEFVNASKDDTRTCEFGEVKYKEGSTLLILSRADAMTVQVFDSRSRESVQCIFGKKLINVGTGEQITVTRDRKAPPEAILGSTGVAFKNLRWRDLSNGLRVYQCTFSIPSALSKIPPLKELGQSRNETDRQLYRRLLKNAVLLKVDGQLTENKALAFSATEGASLLETRQNEPPATQVLSGSVEMVERRRGAEKDFEFEKVFDLRIPCGKFNPTVTEDAQLVFHDGEKWRDMENGKGGSREQVAAVLVCKEDTLVVTDHCCVLCKKDASVFIVADKQKTNVVVLSASGVNGAEVLVGNKVGRLNMATRKKVKPQILPPPDAGASAEELNAYFEKYGLDELEVAGYVHHLTPAEEKEMDKLAAGCEARVAARKAGRTQLNLAMSAD